MLLVVFFNSVYYITLRCYVVIYYVECLFIKGLTTKIIDVAMADY